MSKIINQDHVGNVNMLIIGGDEQYDGKIKTVTEEVSKRPLQLMVFPDRGMEDLPTGNSIDGMDRGSILSVKREHYYPETFYMCDRQMRFYRHESLTAHEAYIKLFEGYNPNV
ncbi:hypothetical protein COPG_00106 [Colwellia phage 9A]|uniref:Uncharacterized protein n=1 Tax=Colwellia phage 9A TaxID=765765 RepID=I3UMI7_9CAUD|nr:hypothetical protein COPG_00106 [Colwellia phage 9A]AFK66702.1 hypothetical protein COPG_00106 [Colwellia phage 9A]